MTKNRNERRWNAEQHLVMIDQNYQKEIMDAVANIQFCKNGRYLGSQATITPRYSATNVRVEDTDSVSAVLSFATDYTSKTAVLNFASYNNPGGGFLSGSLAQEEALCAESTLYPVLETKYDSFYHPHHKNNNRGLYSNESLYVPDIVFMRDGEEVFADVITTAAPNAGSARNKGVSEDEITNTMLERIQTVYNIAARYEVDNLILGAFGCGVFKNNPQVVAQMFKDWIDANPGQFKEVVFAVLPGPNLDAFDEVFDI